MLTKRSVGALLAPILLVVAAAATASAQDALDGRYKKGARLGAGTYKVVYEVKDHPELVLGVLKKNVPQDTLDKEKAQLDRLARVGVPVVSILAMGTFEGRKAYVLPRLAMHDRDDKWFEESWRYLNENSIADADRIQKALETAKLDIVDFQFLVAKDGHVFTCDPLGVVPMEGNELKIFGNLRALRMDARAAIELKAKLAVAIQTEDAKRDAEIKTLMGRPLVAWLEPETDPREERVRDAVLRYLEGGHTTERAKEVATAIRSGRLTLRLCPIFDGSKPKPNEMRLLANDHFISVAASVLREGSKKLHPGEGLEGDVVAASQVVAFLEAKGAPELGHDAIAKRYRALGENPTELVRELDKGKTLDDAGRSRLALRARTALQAARPKTAGIGGSLDRLREREKERTRDRVRIR